MKKANLFLPVLTILVFVFCVILAIVTASNLNTDVKDRVGYSTAVIINTYNERDRMLYYLEKSSVYANEQTWIDLYANAGYDPSSCQKVQDLQGASYSLWNSCPKLDIRSEYSKIFTKNMIPYISSFNSLYSDLQYRPGKSKNYNETMTKLFKEQVSLDKVNNVNNKLVLSFKPIILKSEDNIASYEIPSPRFYVNTPDTSIFSKLHSLVMICKSDKNQVQSCITKIKSSFPDASVESDGAILRINIMQNLPVAVGSTTEKYPLLVAVDLSQDLQEIEDTKLF